MRGPSIPRLPDKRPLATAVGPPSIVFQPVPGLRSTVGEGTRRAHPRLPRDPKTSRAALSSDASSAEVPPDVPRIAPESRRTARDPPHVPKPPGASPRQAPCGADASLSALATPALRSFSSIDRRPTTRAAPPTIRSYRESPAATALPGNICSDRCTGRRPDLLSIGLQIFKSEFARLILHKTLIASVFSKIYSTK